MDVVQDMDVPDAAAFDGLEQNQAQTDEVVGDDQVMATFFDETFRIKLCYRVKAAQ